jgi:hypothetical protein
MSDLREEFWTGLSPCHNQTETLVGGSARLVASVASWEVTTMAKRTQQLCRVGD